MGRTAGRGKHVLPGREQEKAARAPAEEAEPCRPGLPGRDHGWACLRRRRGYTRHPPARQQQRPPPRRQHSFYGQSLLLPPLSFRISPSAALLPLFSPSFLPSFLPASSSEHHRGGRRFGACAWGRWRMWCGPTRGVVEEPFLSEAPARGPEQWPQLRSPWERPPPRPPQACRGASWHLLPAYCLRRSSRSLVSSHSKQGHLISPGADRHAAVGNALLESHTPRVTGAVRQRARSRPS